MIVQQADRPIVKWAVDNGLVYSYQREYGMPEPALCVRLGLSRAYFAHGQLVHWRADAPGQFLDQLMFELTCLFTLCRQIDAYPPQEVFLSEQEMACLHWTAGEDGQSPPRAKSA